LYGLTVSIFSAFVLYKAGILSEFGYNVGFILTLHFYYIYRYYCIAHQRFGILALAEILISLICLIVPFFVSFYLEATQYTPYKIYLLATFIGLLVVSVFSEIESSNKDDKTTLTFQNIKNVSISFTASIFAIFMMPAMIKTTVTPEVVSVVALSISCVSIIMLIPRTYANKIMSRLAQKNISNSEFKGYLSFYSRLIFISACVGVLITTSYLYLLQPEVGYLLFIIPFFVSLIMVFAQHGFICMTFLSLQGQERKVAHLNLFVLAVMAVLSMGVFVGGDIEFLLYFIVGIACVSFGIRNKLAAREVSNYLVK
jgi:hypothetical protein